MMFETKNEVAEWRILFDAIRPLPEGSLISYEQFEMMLGRDLRGDRAPIYRTQRQMLADDNRTLVNVPGVGYRISKPDEHEGLAVGYRKGARRKMKKAIRVIDGTDRSRLSAKASQRLTAVEVNMRAQDSMLRRTEARVSILEKNDAKQDDRIEMLVAQLKAKGIEVDLGDEL